MVKRSSLLLFFFICKAFAYAQDVQRYDCYSYNVNEGLLQSTINEMVFDRDNFCWLSFPNGLQKFDGVNFTNIPVQQGLPDDKFIRFFRSNNGDLLLSHSGGISRYAINSNRFIVIYTNPLPSMTPSQFIGQDGNIIYFCSETGLITAMDSRSFNVLAETKAGIAALASDNGPVIKFSDNIINHRIGILANYKLYLWDLQRQQLIDSSATMPDISYFLLQMKNDNELFYYTYKQNNALQWYNFASKKNTPLFVQRKDQREIYRCHLYKWGNKQLVCFYNQLFETDSTLQVLKNELVNVENQSVSDNIGVAKIKEDNYGNLWLQTVTGGIKKISRKKYPVQYYGTKKKEDNNIMCLLPDKVNNRVLAGAVGNGLLVFDTTQHLIKHIKTLPGKSLPFTANCIVKKENGDYLLFVNGEKKIWLLSKNLTTFTSINIKTSLNQGKTGIHYFGNFLYQDKNRVIAQAQGRIYIVALQTGEAVEHEFTNAYTMSGILYNNMIVTHAGDELIFLDSATCAILKKIPFANTGNVRCFAKDMFGHIYIGSNKGIFKIDANGKIVWHLNKTNGLPDECIYAIAVDGEGILWCSSNKGVFKINKNNSIQQLKKEDGLQENEFNTNAVARAADGELFFGGTNGVSSFYPATIINKQENVQLLFTGITFNNLPLFKDTAVTAITSMELPYDKNALSFNFIAMGPDNPDQYLYQYKMEGIDKEWIQSNKVQTVHYLLQPGKYVLKIYAGTFFNKYAIALKQISIIIHPPYWKSWWFITAIILIIIALLIAIINQYNKTRFSKKLQQLEIEQELKQERERISRDLHDSLGVYANAVLYNAELLHQEFDYNKRNELTRHLKFASKDIITSLRETIWALGKERYSAEDCLLRVRNFIQPFSRYYSHINFIIQGDAAANFHLHSKTALDIVRTVQEAVSNAIKHAEPTNVYITSLMENNKWKLTVKDDGLGFDFDKASIEQKGNGLANMKRRAIDSHFSISITSSTGAGTVIELTVYYL